MGDKGNIQPQGAPSCCTKCGSTEEGTLTKKNQEWLCDGCMAASKPASTVAIKCGRCYKSFSKDKLKKSTTSDQKIVYYCLPCVDILVKKTKERKKTEVLAGSGAAGGVPSSSAGDAIGGTPILTTTDSVPASGDAGGGAIGLITSDEKPQETTPQTDAGGTAGDGKDGMVGGVFESLATGGDPRQGVTSLTGTDDGQNHDIPREVCCSCSRSFLRTDLKPISGLDNVVMFTCRECYKEYQGYERRRKGSNAAESVISTASNRSRLSQLSDKRKTLTAELQALEKRKKTRELLTTIEQEEEELIRLLQETRIRKASAARLCEENLGPTLTPERIKASSGPQLVSPIDIEEWLEEIPPSHSQPRIRQDNFTLNNNVPSSKTEKPKPSSQNPRQTLRWEDLDLLRNTVLEDTQLPEPRKETSTWLPSRKDTLNDSIRQVESAAVARVRRLLPEQLVARKYLPKELPVFSGDPAEWPRFISSYLETQAHCNYSERENMMRLRPALKGEALQLVEDLLNYPQNLECVLNSLRTMYGNPEKIRKAVGQKIRTLPSIRSDDLASVTWLANKVKGICSTLQAAQLDRELWNHDYLAEVESKLPSHLLVSWGVYKIQAPDCSLNTFAIWLSNIGEATVMLGRPQTQPKNASQRDNPRRSGQLFTHSSPSKTSKNAVETHKGPVKCGKCDGEHQLEDCGDFKDLAVNARWDLAIQKKLCFRCLRDHNFKTCTNHKKCGINDCDRKHHQLLHTPQPEDRLPSLPNST